MLLHEHMLFRYNPLHSGNHMQYINTQRGKDADLLNVTA